VYAEIGSEQPYSGAKVFPCSLRRRKFKPDGFAKNLPLSLRASVFFAKNLTSAKHYFLIAPETRSLLTGSDTA
jgi:hypothetical protein